MSPERTLVGSAHIPRSAMVLMVLFAFASPALAAKGKITSLTVSPTAPTPVGSEVTIRIGHSGKKCGYVLDPGEGGAQPVRTLTGAAATMPFRYQTPGAKTVKVWGEKINDNKLACKGGTQTASVAVQAADAPRGNRLQREATDSSKGLAPSSVRKKRKADETGFTKIPPKATKSGGSELVYTSPPVIEHVFFIGEGAGGNVLGPGGTVAIKGRYFGSAPGRIVIYGTGSPFGPDYRYGEIELTHLKWVDDGRINGRIPSNITTPLEPIPITIRVHRQDGKVSEPKAHSFQVASETRWLTWDDVKLAECGNDANADACNRYKVAASGQCGVGILDAKSKVSFDYQPEPGTAIEGYHKNCSGAVGDDTGTDKYEIRLRDGWVFDRVVSHGRKPRPNFPHGGTSWNPRVSWVVEPGDDLHYWAKIQVRRPVR